MLLATTVQTFELVAFSALCAVSALGVAVSIGAAVALLATREPAPRQVSAAQPARPESRRHPAPAVVAAGA